MLKWFRKYNKYILVVGSSLLMVAFLLPGTLQQCGQSQTGYVLGTVGEDGVEVTQIDQQNAAADVQTLSGLFGAIHQLLPMFAGVTREDQPAITWILMKHDAAAMGLSAGPSQVATLLNALDVDEAQEQRLTQQLRITRERLYALLADWLVVQEYKELVAGRAHMAPEHRLAECMQIASQYAAIGKQLGDAGSQQQFLLQYLRLLDGMMARKANQKGLARLSEPLVQRQLVDQFTTLSIEAVEVSPDQYLPGVAAPDEQRLAELFDKHKSDLAGEGEPFGLGYRYPDRVRIEYLTIPFDRVLKASSVDETKAVEYYDKNPAEFTELVEPTKDQAEGEDAEAATEDADAAAPEPKSVLRPYEEVRDRIVARLKRDAAEKLAQKMVTAARSTLTDNMRNLKRDEGYLAVAADWEPIPLRKVAERLQSSFGVLPDVTRRDDSWLSADDLRQLEGIGHATLPLARRRVSFDDYVMSVRELCTDDKNPLLTLRLQVKSPSHALRQFDGTRYLFRLIDAQSAHDPESLDEVRAQVERDAKRLSAYQKLIDAIPTWRKRLNEAESLAELAKELDTTVVKPQPFPRRKFGRTGVLETPTIDQIGRDEAFVDELFAVADRLAASGDVSALPGAQRSAAIRCDSGTSVYLVRIEDRKSMKRCDYDAQLGGGQANDAVDAADAAITGVAPADPFSYDAVAARIDWREGK